MRHVGCAGHTTASSVPGGLFGAAPEPQVRERLDGRAGGRGNSSSVAGGIFGADDAPLAKQRHFDPTKSSLPGGIFGGNSAWAADAAGMLPGSAIQQQQPGAFEGAAGGRSTNAAQLYGHFRGGTRGGPARQHAYEASPGYGGDDDFLAALDEAEQRDDEHAAYVESLQTAAEDLESIRAAAAQLAAEQGLDARQQQALELRLQQRLWEQAREAEELAPPPPARPPPQAAPAQYSRQPPPPQKDHPFVRRPGSSPRVSNKPTSYCVGHAYDAYTAPAAPPAGGYQRSSPEPYERHLARAPGAYSRQPGSAGGWEQSGGQAAGGRAANTSSLIAPILREPSGLARHDPNASSIPGGIFG
jgi:hypothetical protein